MAKFTLKKPKRPSRYTGQNGGERKRKSASVYLEQLKSYEARLKKWKSAKTAHEKAKSQKPSNKSETEIKKILNRL